MHLNQFSNKKSNIIDSSHILKHFEIKKFIVIIPVLRLRATGEFFFSKICDILITGEVLRLETRIILSNLKWLFPAVSKGDNYSAIDIY